MRHSLRMGLCMGGVVLATATALAIGTIKELSLDDGRDDVNRLTAPAVDGSRTAVAIGTIAATFDKGAKIVRRGATGFMTRGPEYNLDKSLDLGALFGSALKQEATAMGFGASGASAWQVDAHDQGPLRREQADPLRRHAVLRLHGRRLPHRPGRRRAADRLDAAAQLQRRLQRRHGPEGRSDGGPRAPARRGRAGGAGAAQPPALQGAAAPGRRRPARPGEDDGRAAARCRRCTGWRCPARPRRRRCCWRWCRRSRTRTAARR